MSHDTHSHVATIKNEYEVKSGIRTFYGVASSILFMGVPVGLTEFLRPGGDTLTWQVSFVCTLIATVFAFLSIRGTLKDY